MADCDVKRVTGPYFFRMIADQKSSPKLSSPPVPPGHCLNFQWNFLNCDSLCLKHAWSLFRFLMQELLKEKRNIFPLVRFPEYLICAIAIRFSLYAKCSSLCYFASRHVLTRLKILLYFFSWICGIKAMFVFHDSIQACFCFLSLKLLGIGPTNTSEI